MINVANPMQNIDIYYESLRQVYDEMADWEPAPEPLYTRIFGTVVPIIGVFLILSIVPIIPLGLTYLGTRYKWTLGPINLSFSFSKFALLWIEAVMVGLVLLAPAVWIHNKLTDRVSSKRIRRPRQTLSADQITFINAYESYKELKIFFVSHIDQHVEQSLRAFMRILPDDGNKFYRWHGDEAVAFDIGGTTSFVGPDASPGVLRNYRTYYPFLGGDAPSLPRQIFVARSFLGTFDQLGWFQLNAKTKSILQALVSLRDKLPYRLRERENLPAVLSILENLSQLIYAYLPEHKTYMEQEALSALQKEGDACLERFVEELNALTLVSRHEPAKAPEGRPSRTLREKFYHYHSNYVFLRFTVWFLLIVALTSVAFFAINFFVKLTPDTMATVIIGTSVASAAALAGLLPNASKTTSAKELSPNRKRVPNVGDS